MTSKLRVGFVVALGVVFLVPIQACNDASGPAAIAPRAPARIDKVPSDTETAPAGSAVPVAPGVVVLDSGQMPVAGVVVTFAVVSGGGSVRRGVDTTDANGATRVGAWTLGDSVGVNVLSASAGALKVFFTATSVAGPVATLTKIKGDLTVGTVGTVVNPTPTVRATDEYGNPIAGLGVAFTVSAGEGSITGATPTTDTDGLAALGSWMLGTVAGTDTVVATAPGLPSATFTAIATAGPAAKVVVSAGDNQTAGIGAPVPIRPAAQVLDEHRNPVPNTPVTFQVTSGGGQTQGASPLTDVTGTATVGWVLGTNPGPNTLTATVQGLSPVTFTATGVDYCATSVAYTIGGTISGVLGAAGCVLAPGNYEIRYRVSLAATQLVTFTMASTAFYTSLTLRDSGSTIIASSSDYCQDYYYGCGATNSSSTVTALLGPGTYLIGAGSTDSGASGSFSLSSAAADQNVTGCGGGAGTWIPRTLSTTQSLVATDCATQFHGATYYSDDFAVYLIAGRTYTITMTSTDFDTYLEVVGPQFVDNDDYGGSTNSQIVYTPPATALYTITATTYLGDQTGSYTLTVSEQGGSGSAPARAIRLPVFRAPRSAGRGASRGASPRVPFHPRPPKERQ